MTWEPPRLTRAFARVVSQWLTKQDVALLSHAIVNRVPWEHTFKGSISTAVLEAYPLKTRVELFPIVRKWLGQIDEHDLMEFFTHVRDIKIGSKMEQLDYMAKTATITDAQTLEQLVAMEAESMDSDVYSVSKEVWAKAQAFDTAVEKALMRWLFTNWEELNLAHGPLAHATTPRAVVDVMMTLRGGAGYLYYMEHGGHGVGTWDGDWDVLFVHPKTTIRELSKFVKAQTSRQYYELQAAIVGAVQDPDAVRQASERLTDEQIADILASEGLTLQGQRSGKSGIFYGKPGWGRMVSLGKRDILCNSFYVMYDGKRGETRIADPDTRWNLYKSFSKVNMTETLLRRIATWAKNGKTTAEQRQVARDFLKDKLNAPETLGQPRVTVQFQNDWKAPIFHTSEY